MAGLKNVIFSRGEYEGSEGRKSQAGDIFSK